MVPQNRTFLIRRKFLNYLIRNLKKVIAETKSNSGPSFTNVSFKDYLFIHSSILLELSLIESAIIL